MRCQHSNLVLSVLVLSLLAISFVVAPAAAKTTEPIFTVHLSIDANSDIELKMATSIREEMAKIGVDVQIESVESETLSNIQYSEEGFKTFEDGGYDLSFALWWWWPTDYVWFEGCWSASGEIPLGWNFMHWSNGEADMYLRAGMSTYNLTERELNLKAWQQVFMEDVPVVQIYWPVTFQLTDAALKGADAVMWTHNIYQWSVEGKTAADDVTIRYAASSDPRMLNPLFMDGGWAHLEPQFRPLFHQVAQPDGSYKMEPAMAESYVTSPDGLTVTIHLRKGITWHDGKSFSANDVKMTFDAVLDPDTGASMHGDFASAVESVDIVDEDTITLKLLSVAPHLINMLTSGTLCILPSHILKDVPHADWRTHDTNTIAPAPGTGPYKFVEWIKDQYMTIEAFDDYFAGRPFVDRVILTIIPESTTALAALEAHEVEALHPGYSDDLLLEIPRLQTLTDIGVTEFQAPAIQFLAFNLKHPILSNKFVRKAFASAINYQHIIDDFMEGFAQKANSPIPPYWFAYNPDVVPYEYNLEQAAAYLEKAGYKPPVTVFTTVTSMVPVPELLPRGILLGLLFVTIVVMYWGRAKRNKRR